MAKNYIGLGNKGARGALAWFACALALAALTWGGLSFFAAGEPERGLALCGLGISSVLLALSVTQSLGYVQMMHGWRYRLGFLAPPAVYLIYWIFQAVAILLAGERFSAGLEILAGLAVVLLAAFSGGLIATGINEGLWENNSPPPAHIKEQVHQYHISITGPPAILPRSKRVFDLLLALLGLILSLPIWLLSLFLVWFEDPGPVLFVKNSVGLDGVNFHQFKLRTMVCGAEESTGPVLSKDGDLRVLAFGRLLRKTAPKLSEKIGQEGYQFKDLPDVVLKYNQLLSQRRWTI